MKSIHGKEIEMCATESWNDKFRGLEARMYSVEALRILQKHPVDMLIFETKVNEKKEECKMTIRSAGYNLFDESIPLDEETILLKEDSLPTEKFWLKIDDYGNKFVGTFLFPSEY